MTERHYSREEWVLYIERSLKEASPETERMEAHLYACDGCLGIYMECLETADALPAFAETNREADDRVMASILSLPVFPAAVSQTESKPVQEGARIWYHPVFHYAVAAAITLLLMSTGVFQQMISQVQRMETTSVTEQAQTPSVTEKLMEKTLHALNAIQRKDEGGGRP